MRMPLPTDRIGMRKAPCARYAGYWPAVTKMSWTPTYPERPYLTRDEMEAILASIDRTQWRGRRDYALLLTLYNTGARVSEISTLQRNQIFIASKSYVQLHGKGRKDRVVPLWPRTARILKEWFR